MWDGHAIQIFFELLSKPYSNDIKYVNPNNHYQPKQDMMDNWTTIVEKDEDKLFVLQFAYQPIVLIDAMES